MVVRSVPHVGGDMMDMDMEDISPENPSVKLASLPSTDSFPQPDFSRSDSIEQDMTAQSRRLFGQIKDHGIAARRLIPSSSFADLNTHKPANSHKRLFRNGTPSPPPQPRPKRAGLCHLA